MRSLIIISFIIIYRQIVAQDFSKDTTIVRIEKISSNKEKARAYNEATTKAWYYRNLKEALEYSSRGLKPAKKFNDESLSYHKRALKMGQQANNPRAISVCLNNLAITYTRQENYPKAIFNYEECIKIDAKTNDTAGLGDDYNNIALLANNSASGIKYIEKCVIFFHFCE